MSRYDTQTPPPQNGSSVSTLATVQRAPRQPANIAPHKDRYAFEPNDVAQLEDFAERVARSGLVPKSFKQAGPAGIALVCIQGRELGLSACASLQGMTAINGQIGFKAKLVSNLVKQSGVCKLWRVIESDQMVGEVEIQHATWDKPQIVRYTVDDAKTARLWQSTDPWKRFPKDMLIARAITRAVDRHFSEVLGGVQVDATIEDSTVRIAQVEEPAKPKTNKKGSAALRAALLKSEEPAEVIEVEVKQVEPQAEEREEPQAEEREESPTRDEAAEQWRSLYSRLCELIGTEAAQERAGPINKDKKRSAKGRQKAIDALAEIVAECEII